LVCADERPKGRKTCGGFLVEIDPLNFRRGRQAMKSFTLHRTEYQAGKCRRCGTDIPSRFFNPYYCWECFRARLRKTAIWIAVITAIILFLIFR
jgi:hypothetical protein